MYESIVLDNGSPGFDPIVCGKLKSCCKGSPRLVDDPKSCDELKL